MVGEALLLLADVQFLDVIDKLLLQAVLVVLHVGDGFESFHDACADFLHSRLLVRLDALQQVLYVVHLLAELLLKGSAFLRTEVYEMRDGVVHSTAHHVPFLVCKRLSLSLCGYVRHAEKRLKPVLRFGYAVLFGDGTKLCVVVVDECGVHGRSVCVRILFHPDGEVHLSADYACLDGLAYLHFLLAVERCDAC